LLKNPPDETLIGEVSVFIKGDKDLPVVEAPVKPATSPYRLIPFWLTCDEKLVHKELVRVNPDGSTEDVYSCKNLWDQSDRELLSFGGGGVYFSRDAGGNIVLDDSRSYANDYSSPEFIINLAYVMKAKDIFLAMFINEYGPNPYKIQVKTTGGREYEVKVDGSTPGKDSQQPGVRYKVDLLDITDLFSRNGMNIGEEDVDNITISTVGDQRINIFEIQPYEKENSTSMHNQDRLADDSSHPSFPAGSLSFLVPAAADKKRKSPDRNICSLGEKDFRTGSLGTRERQIDLYQALNENSTVRQYLGYIDGIADSVTPGEVMRSVTSDLSDRLGVAVSLPNWSGFSHMLQKYRGNYLPENRTPDAVNYPIVRAPRADIVKVIPTSLPLPNMALQFLVAAFLPHRKTTYDVATH
jgi:hypothetical protein